MEQQKNDASKFVSAMEDTKKEERTAEVVEKQPVNEKVVSNHGHYKVDPSAEGVVNSVATINLVIGIVVGVMMIPISLSRESWALFGIGVGVFFVCLVGWAFLKLLVNISHNLYNINEALRKTK